MIYRKGLIFTYFKGDNRILYVSNEILKLQPVFYSQEYDLPWGSRPLPHPPPNGATIQSSGYSSESGAPYACIPIDQYNGCQQQTVMPPQQPCLHHYMTSGGLLTLPGVHHDRHPCNVTRPVNTLPAHAHNNMLSPFINKVSVCCLNVILFFP